MCGRGGMHGRVGTMHGRGACMAEGCVACMAPPGGYYEIWSMSGRYTSYWNASLFVMSSVYELFVMSSVWELFVVSSVWELFVVSSVWELFVMSSVGKLFIMPSA